MRIRAHLHNLVTPFFNPRQVARALGSVPWFVRSWRSYRSLARAAEQPLPRFSDWLPCLTDRHESGGTARGDYFYQDVWAARKVRTSGVEEHVDVASRVDGFVAHCAIFTRVVYVDIRPLRTRVPTIIPKVGSLLALPFSDCSVPSLSCLHVIEHVGLGRYGDPLDPLGTSKSLAELQRVLASGGQLYLGTPIGRPRVCFNGNRISDPRQIIEQLSELELVEFAAVEQDGELVENVAPEPYAEKEYACGLFHFTRRVANA